VDVVVVVAGTGAEATGAEATASPELGPDEGASAGVATDAGAVPEAGEGGVDVNEAADVTVAAAVRADAPGSLVPSAVGGGGTADPVVTVPRCPPPSTSVRS
jgi:hypothetical protein